MEETTRELTLADMDDVIQEYCDSLKDKCDTCPISKSCESCYGDFKVSPRECREAYSTIMKLQESTIPNFEADEVEITEIPDKPEDIVNHPSHYTQGGMECIDEMVMIFGREVVMNFCLCNVWKYRKRALFKNGQEDMDKSNWYMNKYKELSEMVVSNGTT